MDFVTALSGSAVSGEMESFRRAKRLLTMAEANAAEWCPEAEIIIKHAREYLEHQLGIDLRDGREQTKYRYRISGK